MLRIARCCVALFALSACFSLAACSAGAGSGGTAARPASAAHSYPYQLTESEWKTKLTPEQYRILREKGTERAGTGAYAEDHRAGVYSCAGCGQLLFKSEDKFDSGTGWPSYTRPATNRSVATEVDTSYGMRREEVMCSNCGGHLGHVFDDGPAPTGLRYCINSASLSFAAGGP